MRKDRSKGEGLLKGANYSSAFVVKIPRSVFSGKTSEWGDYV